MTASDYIPFCPRNIVSQLEINISKCDEIVFRVVSTHPLRETTRT